MNSRTISCNSTALASSTRQSTKVSSWETDTTTAGVMIGEGMIGGATTEASGDLLEVTGMAEATDMVEARTGGAVVASGVEEGTRAQEKLPRMDGDTPSW